MGHNSRDLVALSAVSRMLQIRYYPKRNFDLLWAPHLLSQMPDPKQSYSNRSFYYFQKILSKSGPAASASYALIGAILLFALVGYFIDNYYQSSPWFTLGGTFLSLIHI